MGAVGLTLIRVWTEGPLKLDGFKEEAIVHCVLAQPLPPLLDGVQIRTVAWQLAQLHMRHAI